MRSRPIGRRLHDHSGRGQQLRVWNCGRGLLGMAEGNQAIPLAMDDQRRARDTGWHFVGQSGELGRVIVEPLLAHTQWYEGFQ